MNIDKEVQNIQKQGNLKKQSRFLKTWRERWFVLTPHYLLTFKQRRSYKNPTQLIPLKSIESIKSAEQELDIPHCFRIDTNEATFFIGAQTVVQKQQWIGAIGKAMVKNNSSMND